MKEIEQLDSQLREHQPKFVKNFRFAFEHDNDGDPAVRIWIVVGGDGIRTTYFLPLSRNSMMSRNVNSTSWSRERVSYLMRSVKNANTNYEKMLDQCLVRNRSAFDFRNVISRRSRKSRNEKVAQFHLLNARR